VVLFISLLQRFDNIQGNQSQISDKVLVSAGLFFVCCGTAEKSMRKILFTSFPNLSGFQHLYSFWNQFRLTHF